MIPFLSPDLGDRGWVWDCLKAAGYRGCEYSFASLFAWGGVYGQSIAKVGDHLVAQYCGKYGCSYLYPAGSGDMDAVLDVIEADAKGRGAPLRFVSLTQEGVDTLEAKYPGQFTFTVNRDGFDYLYDIEKMCNLAGKKLHGKRNHIRRFEDEYPEWRFQPITPADLPRCLELAKKWELERLEEGQEPDENSPEAQAIGLAVDNYEALGMDGGMIIADGEVLAFTMGDHICVDTFDVHFEKAYGGIQGTYPIINREFARYIHEKYPEVRYLNREDDMGLPGLRRAKESYYPEAMVEKFIAIRPL